VTAVADCGYGRQFADFYDRMLPPDPQLALCVDMLAGLHPGGGLPALELGVGTGRVAVPLAERIGEVVGVDSSIEMLDVLRTRLGDRPVTPVHSDMTAFADGRRYGLVYCVCASLTLVLDPVRQADVLTVAARHLAPGGAVVIETPNPAVARSLNGGRPRESVFAPYPEQDTGLLSYSTIDEATAIWHLAHIWFERGQARIATETTRLTTADEIDSYAVAAGLVPAGRYADWAAIPATGAEPMTVSVYRGGDHSG